MTRFVSSLVAGVLWWALANGASAQGTLRIGMTASDIPYTGGQPDNGFEGFPLRVDYVCHQVVTGR